MAEIGSAVLGFAVGKLLDEVLTALQHLKKRSRNLLQLQDLLERLRPSVTELTAFAQDEQHPAGKWLADLRGRLERARDLVEASSDDKWNIFKRIGTSKNFLEVYDGIQALLREASVLHWASGMSIQRMLTEKDAKILELLRVAQEREERLRQNILDGSSKDDILRALSELARISISESLDGSMSPSPAAPIETAHTAIACDIPKAEVTFGGEAVASEVITYLVSRGPKKWVGLWGMGGIGKTCTASKVYHDSSIQRHFSGGTIWLTVSKDQRDPTHLLEQLHIKIKCPGSKFLLPVDLKAAKSYLRSLLDKDRVLLVLDDVWQNDVLDCLDVISDQKNGVILVTTRDKAILRPIFDYAQVFEIPPLSEEHSWQLFSWHAFHVRGKMVTLDVEAVAKSMAAECRGLPLALEVIGSTMACKDLLPEEKQAGLTSLRVWETALEQLRSANHAMNEYEALYRKLQLSVDSLQEQDARLRDCFFYFAAFEEDTDVDVRELVDKWIAEGLVQEDDSLSSGEEQGRFLLACLVVKSMIQMTSTGSRRTCRVHDVMRDLAQRNLKWNFDTGKEIKVSSRDCLYAPGLKQSRVPKEWTVSGSLSSTKRMSLRGNDLRQFPEPEQINTPHLQVLILANCGTLQTLSASFFKNLSHLTVLDLQRTHIERISGKVLEMLKSLTLLDLSFCLHLRKVSNKIDGLQNMRFLYLDKCHALQQLPRVSNLTKLEVYNVLVHRLDATESSQSQRLWPKQNAASRCGVPYTLPPNLRRLKLYAGPFGPTTTIYNHRCDVSSLGSLEELQLESTWLISAGMTALHNLKVLHIGGCDTGQMPAVHELPLLEDLTIELNIYSGAESYGSERAFPSLKKLVMKCTSDMKKMFVFHPGTMPKIESLCLEMSLKEHLPSSIVELSSLKRLELVSEGQQQRFCFPGAPFPGFESERQFQPVYEPVNSDEDLELVFKQPDCFPDLEFLSIQYYDGFEFDIRRKLKPLLITLPKHMLEREEQGLLSIHGKSRVT